MGLKWPPKLAVGGERGSCGILGHRKLWGKRSHIYIYVYMYTLFSPDYLLMCK